MTDLDIDHLRQWIGREETKSELLRRDLERAEIEIAAAHEEGERPGPAVESRGLNVQEQQLLRRGRAAQLRQRFSIHFEQLR